MSKSTHYFNGKEMSEEEWIKAVEADQERMAKAHPMTDREWVEGVLHKFENYCFDGLKGDKPALTPNQATNAILSKLREAKISGRFNRFEVIDHTPTAKEPGRALTKWDDDDFEVEASVQDDGRTLKIFLSELKGKGADNG